MKRSAIQAVVMTTLLSCAQGLLPVWAGPGSSPPAGLMTRIRQFFGIQPRMVSVGGTRFSSTGTVCLLAPGPIQQVNGVNQVLLVQAQPDLVLGTPLNELEIRSGEAVLYSRLATSKAPIAGRLAWPIAAVQPQQQLQLAMRPQGAAGGDWAVLQLVGASKAEMERTARQLQTSRAGTTDQLLALEQLLQRGENGTALEMLWAESASSNPELEKLRKEAVDGCN